MKDVVKIMLSIASFLIGIALMFGLMSKFGFNAPELLESGIENIKQILGMIR